MLLRHHYEGESLSAICIDLGLLSEKARHLRKLASREHQRALQKLRRHVIERAQRAHGVDATALTEFLPRIEIRLAPEVQRGGPAA